jgi:hypothetical protein
VSYWGVEEDLASIATFIDRHLTQNHRQASPKYLVGESLAASRRLSAGAAGGRSSHCHRRKLPDFTGARIQPDGQSSPPDVAPVLLRRRGAGAPATLTPEALGEVEQFALDST